MYLLAARSANKRYAQFVKNTKNLIFLHVPVFTDPYLDDLSKGQNFYLTAERNSLPAIVQNFETAVEDISKWLRQHVAGTATSVYGYTQETHHLQRFLTDNFVSIRKVCLAIGHRLALKPPAF